MNKESVYWVGFILVAALAGLILMAFGVTHALVRLCVTIGAGIGGGVVAEQVYRAVQEWRGAGAPPAPPPPPPVAALAATGAGAAAPTAPGADPLDDEVRRVLRELIVAHGRTVCEDPARVEALLTERCPARRREVFALASALREGVPADLLSGARSGESLAEVLRQLARRLSANLGLAEPVAAWAVGSWAAAFDLALPDAPGPGAAAGR